MEIFNYNPASMTGYHYLVDLPIILSPILLGDVTRTRQLVSDRIIVDIEKVWQNNGGGPPLSPDLKDACLAFSLFQLLRRRFYGFECGESLQPKTRDFVFKGMLAKKKNADDDGAGGEIDYEWSFKVIGVELAFMYDFFFTKYAAIYYGNVVVNVLPLVSASLMVVTAFLTAAGQMRPPSANYQTVGSVILDTTEADVGITVAMLVCICFLQVVQVLYYWTTFACQRVKGGGRCMGLKELLVNIGVFMSTAGRCCWYHYHREEKIAQYSLLESVSNISNQCLVTKVVALCENWFQILFSSLLGCEGVYIQDDVWRVIQKPGTSAKLLPAVKKALVQSLGRTQGKLTYGKSSLLSNGADDLLWACKLRLGSTGTSWSSQKEENQVCVILTWHIATCYCNKELAGAITEDLKEHHEVATTLSKYSAYLVGFQPKLLPGHHYDTWSVFYEVATEAIRKKTGTPEQETIYGKGLKLGDQLKNMEAARCWKILADFWAEMLLYLSPSDNVKEHIECLAEGSEFITQLWALLTHAGILERDQQIVNDIENGGACHSSPGNQQPASRGNCVPAAGKMVPQQGKTVQTVGAPDASTASSDIIVIES